MKKAPFKNYGFTYEYEGSSFVFHIVASSEDEAIGRAKAMAGAKFEGELKEAPAPDEQQKTGRGTTFIIDGPEVEIQREDMPMARVPFLDLLEFAERHPLVPRSVSLLYQAQQEARIELPSGRAGQGRDLGGPPQPGSQ